MAPLKNPKQESFVHNYLKCGDATEAFGLTGYTRDSANAHRLLKRPQVQARLRELQDEIAAKVPISIESLISELEDARTQAAGKNQFAAAIKAILGKAQLAGLLVERSKVEVTDTSPFAGLEDKGDLGDYKRNISLVMTDNYCEYKFAAYHDYTEEDRQCLAEIWLHHYEAGTAEMDAYIEEIHARPKRTVNLRALPSPSNGKDDSQPTTD
jgi:Terminase small subunit